tara:strand:- start:245 stop:1240 length:996 start_codon:yes stop_codon:yes gene_type:complete
MQYFDLVNFKSSLILILIIITNLLILNYRNNFAKLLGIFDNPNERKIHKSPTPLVGGICIFATIIIALISIFFENLISTNKFIIYLLFYIIFFTTGLWDDAKTLSPKIRTLIIVVTIIILIPFESEFVIKELTFKSTSREINFGNFSFLFTIFCIFSVYNALNFIDGYNGSATSIIIFWTLFLLIKNYNLLYLYLFFSMILIFFYNLKGKVFLGNSGTSILSIFFSLSLINDYNIIEDLYAEEILFILLFPGIDMIRVTTERIINSKKIYYADKTHFHHYLIKKKINYIWQSIFILTLMPLILFYITKDIILTILFSLLVYFGLLIKLRKK